MKPSIYSRPTRSVAAWLADPSDAYDNCIDEYVVRCCSAVGPAGVCANHHRIHPSSRAAREFLSMHLALHHDVAVGAGLLHIDTSRPCIPCWGLGADGYCETCLGSGWAPDFEDDR